MRLWSQEGSACHRAMAQSVYPKEAALLFEEQGQSSRESPTGGTWGNGRARPGRPAEWPHLPLELLRFERGQGGIKQPPSPPLCEAHPGTPRPAAVPGAPARLPSAWMGTRARSHPWSSVHWVPRVAQCHVTHFRSPSSRGQVLGTRTPGGLGMEDALSGEHAQQVLPVKRLDGAQHPQAHFISVLGWP